MRKLFTSSLLLVLAGWLLPATAATEATQEEMEKYGQPFKGKISKSYEESKEWWPSTPKPPAGTPNVIIFLLDDTGFGHLGSFGGLIETPNIDKLASNGLRFNNFHTTALCSPSRATIMAGRNHHRIGLGSHSLSAMGFPGYNAFPPESGKSVAKHLQKVGLRQLRHRQVGSHAVSTRVSESRSLRPLAERRRASTTTTASWRPTPTTTAPSLWRDHYPVEDWEGKDDYHWSEAMADEATRNITSHVSVSRRIKPVHDVLGTRGDALAAPGPARVSSPATGASSTWAGTPRGRRSIRATSWRWASSRRVRSSPSAPRRSRPGTA